MVIYHKYTGLGQLIYISLKSLRCTRKGKLVSAYEDERILFIKNKLHYITLRLILQLHGVGREAVS